MKFFLMPKTLNPKKMTLCHLLFVFSCVLNSNIAWSQSNDDDAADISGVEDVYSTSAVPVTPKAKSSFNSKESGLSEKNKADGEVKELKDLSRLAPFSEISIIQKKFLPKTERFQFFIGGTLLTNTPWYNNVGAKLNLSYNFTETLGLELNTAFLTNSKRDAAKEIEQNNRLQAEQFIYTKNYYGLDLIWSPIYGKITSIDQKIIPLDTYFSIGGGISNTNSKEKSNSTLHVGLGQIFAISKSMAFRWDYSFNTFSATPVKTDSVANTPTSNRYNDLIFTAGVSFFFPEAGYR